MNISTYSLIITYVMASLGLAAIWLIESTETSFLVITASFVLLSLVFNVGKGRSIPKRMWNLLAAAILVFFIIDYMTISASLIASSTRFVTVLLVLKLFDLKRNRDFLVAFALIFFQLLATAASTVSPLFIVILTLYIIGGIWAMIIFSIKSDYYAANRKIEIPGNIFGPPFFISIIVVSATSLVITFLLFFIIPRMGVGLFEQSTSSDTVKVTGFSDSVVLGSIGEIKKDSTIVMRVKPLTANYALPLYLRGATLDHYDGAAWSERHRSTALLRNPNGFFRLGQDAAEVFEQKIQLEPLETEVIFGVSHITSIEGGFRNLWADSTGTVRLPAPPYSRIEYKVGSVTTPLKEPDRKMPGEYLELEFLEHSPEKGRIEELANKITRSRTTDMQKAVAIEAYLSGNYRYTLNPARRPEMGPIEDFLFYSKEGFCEHYASSMAILLRSIGIPSRIVTGFLPDEWNSLGEYFIVRAQDSHSWVEAYIKGVGWKTFDPTPPPTGGPLFKASMGSHYIDLLRWRWNRYIVLFNAEDQQTMGRTLGASTSGVLAGLKEKIRSNADITGPKAYALLALAIALAVVLAWLLRRSLFRGGRSRVPGYYMEMLRAVEKRGLRKRADETALEFARRADRAGVDAITEAYQAERYGNIALSAAEELRVKEALEALKKGRA